MALSIDEIKKLITESIPDAIIEIEDLISSKYIIFYEIITPT